MNDTIDRPSYLDRVTVLRRGKGRTDVYHRADCARAKPDRTVPWLWAEGKSRAEVEATAVNGLRPCKVCDPLGALPAES